MIQHVCKIMQQAVKMYIYQYIVVIIIDALKHMERTEPGISMHNYTLAFVSVQRKEEY
jgi:hypothetical protein